MEPFEVIIADGYDEGAYLSTLAEKASDPEYTWPLRVTFITFNGDQGTVFGWLHAFVEDSDPCEVWIKSDADAHTFRVVDPIRVVILAGADGWTQGGMATD